MPEPPPDPRAGDRRHGAPGAGRRGLAARWLALLAAMILLYRIGREGPGPTALAGRWGGSPPPLRPPVETVMAVARLLALGAGAYLLVILTVALAGQALRHRPTLTLATWLTPPSLRATLALATGAGAALGVTGGGAGAATPPAPILHPAGLHPPDLQWTGPAGGPASSTAPVLRWTGTGTDPAPPRLRWTGPAVSGPAPLPSGPTAAPPTARPAEAPPASRPTPPPVRRRRRPSGGPVRYVVRPGDSFWNIAAARLQDGGAVAVPDDQSVARYWRLLLQANAKVLPVPGQPDLLFPGDRIELPPLP